MLLYNENYLESLKINSERFTEWEKLRDRTILITGGTGLIGSYMVDMIMFRAVQEGLDVKLILTGRDEKRAMERFEKWFFCGNMQFIKQDMKEPLCIDTPSDYVIHGAGNAYPAVYDKDPVGTMKANLLGTDGLLEYGVRSGAENFVLLSSGEIYGERDETWGVSEEFCGKINYTDSRSCYPVSKIAAETLCVSYEKQYGIHTNIARLCHVYGPTMTKADNRVINQFLRNALNGEDIVMKSSGSKVRSYCYVADAVLGIMDILTKGESSMAYNVAYKNSVVSIREIAELTAELGGSKVIMSDEKEAGGTVIEKSILDGKRLEELGWKGKYSMSEGLEECFKILQQEIN